MKASIRCVWVVLALILALAVNHVVAGSEITHAVELIYFYEHYRLEELVFSHLENPKTRYTIGTQCIGTKPGGRCNFNEFINYVTTGRTVNSGPQQPFVPNGAPNLSNEAERNSLARKIAASGLSAGNIQPSRVVANRNGFVGLYNDMATSLSECNTEANKKDAPAGTKDWLNVWKPVVKDTLQMVVNLRDAASQAVLSKEMTAKFPNDSRMPVYINPDGGRFKTIDWKVTKLNYLGERYDKIDFAATNAANPQLVDGKDPTGRSKLGQAVDDWVIKFWQNDPKLITSRDAWDKSNKMHKTVYDKANSVLNSACFS